MVIGRGGFENVGDFKMLEARPQFKHLLLHIEQARGVIEGAAAVQSRWDKRRYLLWLVFWIFQWLERVLTWTSGRSPSVKSIIRLVLWQLEPQDCYHITPHLVILSFLKRGMLTHCYRSAACPGSAHAKQFKQFKKSNFVLGAVTAKVVLHCMRV